MFTLFSIQTDGCGNLYSVDEEGLVLATIKIQGDDVTKCEYRLLAELTWESQETQG